MTVTDREPPPVATYRPNPGDWTLITLHALCLADGVGGTLVYRVDGVSGEALTINSGEDAFVRAEPSPKPALPPAFGSLIVATIGMIGGAQRMRLVRIAEGNITRPWRAENGSTYADSHLSDVEVPTTEEAARLRGLLEEAVDGWSDADARSHLGPGVYDPNPRINQIHREANLP